MIFTIILIIVCLFLSVVFHELGHIITYTSITNRVPEINISWKEITVNYPDIPYWDHIGVILVGILSGLIPLLFLMDYMRLTDISSSVLVILYLSGCIFDITEILKSLKAMGRKTRRGF